MCIVRTLQKYAPKNLIPVFMSQDVRDLKSPGQMILDYVSKNEEFQKYRPFPDPLKISPVLNWMTKHNLFAFIVIDDHERFYYDETNLEKRLRVVQQLNYLGI